MCVCVCEKLVEKWVHWDSDNGFKNDISSLFQKNFIRMTSFQKFSIEGNR